MSVKGLRFTRKKLAVSRQWDWHKIANAYGQRNCVRYHAQESTVRYNM